MAHVGQKLTLARLAAAAACSAALRTSISGEFAVRSSTRAASFRWRRRNSRTRRRSRPAAAATRAGRTERRTRRSDRNAAGPKTRRKLPVFKRSLLKATKRKRTSPAEIGVVGGGAGCRHRPNRRRSPLGESGSEEAGEQVG